MESIRSIAVLLLVVLLVGCTLGQTRNQTEEDEVVSNWFVAAPQRVTMECPPDQVYEKRTESCRMILTPATVKRSRRGKSIKLRRQIFWNMLLHKVRNLNLICIMKHKIFEISHKFTNITNFIFKDSAFSIFLNWKSLFKYYFKQVPSVPSASNTSSFPTNSVYH